MTPYTEDDLLPLSGLQHLIFCERQCALIHIERLWDDNSLTIEGAHMHKWVHEELPRREVRGDLVILRGLSLKSMRLGLVGVADVVEFQRRGRSADEEARDGLRAAVPMKGLKGFWAPYPVEYKHGKPKSDHCDEVQLCAQAICLEEMLDVHISEGSLFYGKVKRRQPVHLDEALRELTVSTACRLHELVESGKTPRAVKKPVCRSCSLKELCLPKIMGANHSAGRYLSRAMDEILKGKSP